MNQLLAAFCDCLFSEVYFRLLVTEKQETWIIYRLCFRSDDVKKVFFTIIVLEKEEQKMK